MITKTTKYLEAFTSAEQVLKENFKLIGDLLLVELLKDDEVKKTKSGLFMPTMDARYQAGTVANEKPTFVRVLMAGQGYFEKDENGIIKDIPLDSQPGDILLVPAHAVKLFSVFGSIPISSDLAIGIVRDSEVQARFKGYEGFETFFRSLDEELAKPDSATG
jgi:uracil phosphoribosyltransferase